MATWKEPSEGLKAFCKEFSQPTKVLISAVMRDSDFIGGLSQRTQDAGVKNRAELLLAGMAVYEDEIRPELVAGGLAPEKQEAKPAEASSPLGEILKAINGLVEKVDGLSGRLASVEKLVNRTGEKLSDLYPDGVLRGENPAQILSRIDNDVIAARSHRNRLERSAEALAVVVGSNDESMSAFALALNSASDTIKEIVPKIDSLAERCDVSPPAVSTADPAVLEKISSLAEELRASKIEAEERRKASIAAAEQKKAERAAAKLAREAEVAKSRAEKKERARLAAEARVASKARKEEVRVKKARGENPYTPEETAKFRERLEKKGKTYYTPEQRAAYKADHPDSAKKANKPFRFYTEAQKAQFIRDNFTSKGRTYYTKEQRRIFREKALKAAKAAKAPTSD